MKILQLRCVLTFIDAITSLDCPVKNCSFSGRHESAFDVFVAELTGFVLLHLHSIGAARPRWGAALIEPILLVELLNCTLRVWLCMDLRMHVHVCVGRKTKVSMCACAYEFNNKLHVTMALWHTAHRNLRSHPAR